MTGISDDEATATRARIASVTSTAEAGQVLLGGITCASPKLRDLARVAASLVDEQTLGDLGAGAQLADDLTVLARTVQLLAAETARRAHAADVHDVTATGVTTTLTQSGWSESAAWRCLNAGSFATTHPTLLTAWRAGTVNVDTITNIAHQVRGLSAADAEAVVTWVTPLLPQLSERDIKTAVAAAVDRLAPQDADARERRAYDERYLTSTRFRDQVMIEARLPALEGEAFLATVEAFAQKLRSEDDGLTKAQRAADALSAMVAALAAEAKTPTVNGHPAAATVLIPLSEAERVTNGDPRTTQPLPDLDPCLPFDRLGAARQAQGGATGSGSGQCGTRPFSALPLTPGTIGHHHTLGDAAAKFLLCSAELTGAIVTAGHDPNPTPRRMLAALLGAATLQPLALGRAQRFASTAQRKALEIRDRGCVIPGCRIEPRHCQTHHQPGWAEGGCTDTDRMALLCWSHHRQVDLGRWWLQRNPDPTGPHWLVTPQPRAIWRPRR